MPFCPRLCCSVCSSENGMCNFTGTAAVFFGVAPNWLFKTITNGTPCTVSIFGGDPAVGSTKACFIPAPPLGYTFCGQEGGNCNFTGTTNVAFGRNGGAFTFQNLTSFPMGQLERPATLLFLALTQLRVLRSLASFQPGRRNLPYAAWKVGIR